MVGAAVWSALEAKGYTQLIGSTSTELDLRDQAAVAAFLKQERPDTVIDAAARVGGISANMEYPYPFLMDNLQLQTNLIDGSLKAGVQKFIFLGSSCVYPRLAPQPLREDYLLTGALEPTNEWYAIAKIAGIKLCEAVQKQFGKDYFSLMPTNLYGPGDNFDLQTSHVLPAMLRKFHEAKQYVVDGRQATVTLWGSGSPMREFLFVEDLAEAVVFALENNFTAPLYNVGTGEDLMIRELAELIQKVVGHTGEIQWDASKPDGTPRKLMDVSKMSEAGWKAKTSLEDGIQKTYAWYVEHQQQLKEIKMDGTSQTNRPEPRHPFFKNRL